MKNLRTMLFHLLLESPQTGYSIAKQTEARTGWKPSWGSIYPLLETLESEGVITGKQKGRSKEYTLTAAGKKTAEKHVSQTQELLGEIIDRLRVMQEFCQEDVAQAITYLKALQQTGENPFAPIEKESLRMRNQLHRLWGAQLVKRRAKDINAALAEATRKLERIQ